MSRTVAGVLILALIVTAAALTNRTLLETRMNEIDLLLDEVSAAEEAAGGVGIVVRFELIKRRLALGEQRVENYRLEARLQALVDTSPASSDEVLVEQIDGGGTTRWISAFFRTLIGRPPLRPPSGQSLSALEEAYLWERTRHYERAIAIYDRLISEGPPDFATLDKVILLHKAFCQAMIGQYQTARAACVSLSEAEDKEVALVALEVIRFLDFVAGTQQRISNAELPSFELGRSLYYATDYGASVRVLRRFLEETDADPRSAEARYFMARAMEELGRTQTSIEEYRRVMLLDPDGPWSRESNRRLVMIGSFYQNDQSLTENARRRLERMGDLEFAAAVEPFQELAQLGFTPGAVETAQGDRPEDRGELFIQTNPKGAVVVVNGVEMGRSPVFVTDVPFGPSVIRASSGALAGEARVNVDRAEIIPVVLSLGIAPGGLRIVTSLTNAQVSLDDRTIRGGVDSPALNSLAPGQYVILVRGSDADGRVIYWEDLIRIQPGQTLTVRVP